MKYSREKFEKAILDWYGAGIDLKRIMTMQRGVERLHELFMKKHPEALRPCAQWKNSPVPYLKVYEGHDTEYYMAYVPEGYREISRPLFPGWSGKTYDSIKDSFYMGSIRDTWKRDIGIGHDCGWKCYKCHKEIDKLDEPCSCPGCNYEGFE